MTKSFTCPKCGSKLHYCGPAGRLVQPLFSNEENEELKDGDAYKCFNQECDAKGESMVFDSNGNQVPFL